MLDERNDYRKFVEALEGIILGVLMLIIVPNKRDFNSDSNTRRKDSEISHDIDVMYKEYCDHTPEDEQKSKLVWYFTTTRNIWLEEKEQSPNFIGVLEVVVFSLIAFVLSVLLSSIPIPYWSIVMHLAAIGSIVWAAIEFIKEKTFRFLSVLLNPFLYIILIDMIA